jgi:hypothetical protein
LRLCQQNVGRHAADYQGGDARETIHCCLYLEARADAIQSPKRKAPTTSAIVFPSAGRASRCRFSPGGCAIGCARDRPCRLPMITPKRCEYTVVASFCGRVFALFAFQRKKRVSQRTRFESCGAQDEATSTAAGH